MAINQPDLGGDVTAGLPSNPVTNQGGSANTNSPSGAIPLGNNNSPFLVGLQQRYRPPSFLNFYRRMFADGVDPASASRDLDNAIQRAFTNIYTLESMMGAAQQGVVTVTGSKTGIATGLTTIKTCVAAIDNGSAAHNFWLSIQPSKTAGAVDIFVWQPTSNANNTPTAATSAVKIRWSAIGTLGT